MHELSDEDRASSPSTEDSSTPSTETGAVRLRAHISAAEALAVFRRKVPGSDAEVREVTHPFWWARLGVRTTGMFTPSSRGRIQRMNVLVNAHSGRGFIADFDPLGEDCGIAEWREALTHHGGSTPIPDVDAIGRTARALVRTKVLKTVKLGMRIGIDDLVVPRPVLKPNWLITGANEKHSATILVDGLDSSHYVVRAGKAESR